MLVTAAVSQSAIGPYMVVAVVGFVTHANTAAPMLLSVMAAVDGGRVGTAVLHPPTHVETK